MAMAAASAPVTNSIMTSTPAPALASNTMMMVPAQVSNMMMVPAATSVPAPGMMMVPASTPTSTSGMMMVPGAPAPAPAPSMMMVRAAPAPAPGMMMMVPAAPAQAPGMMMMVPVTPAAPAPDMMKMVPAEQMPPSSNMMMVPAAQAPEPNSTTPTMFQTFQDSGKSTNERCFPSGLAEVGCFGSSIPSVGKDSHRVDGSIREALEKENCNGVEKKSSCPDDYRKKFYSAKYGQGNNKGGGGRKQKDKKKKIQYSNKLFSSNTFVG